MFVKGPSDWRWFDIDEDVELSPVATVAVAFRDSDGKEVATTRLPLTPCVPCFSVRPSRGGGVVPHTVFLSPFFLIDAIWKIVVAESVTVHGELTVENELFSRVHTINADLRKMPSGQMEANIRKAPSEQTEANSRKAPFEQTEADSPKAPLQQTEAFVQESKQNDRGFRRKPIATSTPEPSTIVLLGAGAIAFLGYRWCRRRVK